jgi:hypothetical protein
VWVGLFGGEGVGGRNHFEADFYPPLARLTGGVQKLSDSELYLIVAHGSPTTAMPAFAKAHSHDDSWRAVLWVRHLVNLSSGEKMTTAHQMKCTTEESREHHATRQLPPSSMIGDADRPGCS